MSEGTTLDALESGDIRDAADASRMEAIRRDMDAAGAELVDMAPPPPAPVPQQQLSPPPHYYQQPPQRRQREYIPMDEAEDDEEEVVRPSRRSKRHNLWSDVMNYIQEPLIVSILLFVLNLPVLHTFLAKYAAWAFAVGGQLSWLGLIALSMLGGTVFGLYKTLLY